MEKVITAQEFIKSEVYNPFGDNWTDMMTDNDLFSCMSAFARFHVQATLKAVEEYIKECNPDDDPEIIKNLGVTLYPLENIK